MTSQKAPVQVTTQRAAVLTPQYPGAYILTQPSIVVGRKFEKLTTFADIKQANRYKVMDPSGRQIGFIAEESGFMTRQFLRNNRPFKAFILDAAGKVVFKIERPFVMINSSINIYTVDDRLIGHVKQHFHLFRRKYELFVGSNSFANINTPFLGWEFDLKEPNGGLIGSITRDFRGFAREIFTDSGQYVLHMDTLNNRSRGMTLDERAVAIACAISIDFDYFSRISEQGYDDSNCLPVLVQAHRMNNRKGNRA